MRVCGEAALSRSRQQLAKRGIAGKIPAHDERVHEEPDDAFELRPASVRDRSANQQIGLAAIPVQQCLKGGQERHEDGHSFMAAERADVVEEPPRPREAVQGSARRQRRRTSPIGRKRDQRRRSRELLAPERELPFKHVSRQLFALPEGKVRVLEWRIIESNRLALNGQPIQCRQLTDKYGRRPAVGHDVVHRDEQTMAFAIQLQNGDTKKRPPREIERLPRFSSGEPLGLRLAIEKRERSQIDDRNTDGDGRLDHLNWAVVLHDERRSQRFMAADQLVYGALEGVDSKRTIEPKHGGHVVCGARRQAFGQPQPLLRE